MANDKRAKTDEPESSGSRIEREGNGTIKIFLTIPWGRVKESFERLMEKALSGVEVPGFRKGKAPKEKASDKIDKSKVYEEVIRDLLPQTYAAAVAEHKIRPAIYPKVRIEKAKEGEEWQFSVLTCEAPEVALGDYKEKIKQELSGEKKGATQEEKEQKVIAALLKLTEVKVPDLLAEEEANYRLSHLIEKTEKLGVTIEQYLSSIHKTDQELRSQYAQEARRAIATEMILNEVFNAEKLTVDETEIERLIEASGDETLKKNLQKDEQKAKIRRILARRSALEFLVKLGYTAAQ